MINYVPKVMIYRIGKYTPYKGLSQEIEIMLKIINNDDAQKAQITLSQIELENPQDYEQEEQKTEESESEKKDKPIIHQDKVHKA